MRLKPPKESLDSGRVVRSLALAPSARGPDAGEGEVGRLAGRRNEGVLSAYMSSEWLG